MMGHASCILLPQFENTAALVGPDLGAIFIVWEGGSERGGWP
jgi:hypothetical protein